MPFTGSHVAAVLPFIRWLPPSALALGSMAPDLPYYLGVVVDARLTHSIPGIVTIDLVLGTAGFLAWQCLIGPAVVALAPGGLQARLDKHMPGGLRHHLGSAHAVILVVVALVLGSATHVVWDSFTHDSMWGPRHLAWLAGDVGPLPGYKWAQHLSGLIGGIALTGWARRWWRSHPPVGSAAGPAVPTRARHLAWMSVACSALGGTLVGGLPSLDGDAHAQTGVAFGAARGGGAASIVSLTAVAVVWAISWRGTCALVTRCGGNSVAGARCRTGLCRRHFVAAMASRSCHDRGNGGERGDG